MELGDKRIPAGNISFALSYRLLDGGAPHTTGAGSPGERTASTGWCGENAGPGGWTKSSLDNSSFGGWVVARQGSVIFFV